MKAPPGQPLRRTSGRVLSPAKAIAGSFLGAIVLGTILLWLP